MNNALFNNLTTEETTRLIESATRFAGMTAAGLKVYLQGETDARMIALATDMMNSKLNADADMKGHWA